MIFLAFCLYAMSASFLYVQSQFEQYRKPYFVQKQTTVLLLKYWLIIWFESRKKKPTLLNRFLFLHPLFCLSFSFSYLFSLLALYDLPMGLLNPACSCAGMCQVHSHSTWDMTPLSHLSEWKLSFWKSKEKNLRKPGSFLGNIFEFSSIWAIFILKLWDHGNKEWYKHTPVVSICSSYCNTWASVIAASLEAELRILLNLLKKQRLLTRIC